MFGKNANNKGAEATGKRTSSKKVKMNRKNMKYAISAAICVLFIATVFSGAGRAEANPNPVTIKYTEIGTGNLCYSFAIIADLHVDIGNPQNAANLNAVVTEINSRISTDKIKFVIVLGDLIQGEKATQTTYQDEFDTAKTGSPSLQGLQDLEIPWIPMIGNHDVWCNLLGSDIHFPTCYTIPQYTPSPDYPEKLFENTFGLQYDDLSNILAHWTKQEVPPNGFNNWYDSTFPNIYTQNFAFGYGKYHFICLDFCARDDFQPNKVDVIPGVYWYWDFGYADLHDVDPINSPITDGTWNWFTNHLANCPTMRTDENTIIFSHQSSRSHNFIWIQ